MFVGALEDRLAIRERIDAYCDAVFRHDADDWIGCWSAEPVWRLPGAEVAGRGPMRAAWEGAMAGFPLAAFFANAGSIVVDGDTAKARVYTQEILRLTDGAMRRIIGAYDDDLVKEGDGVWRFSRRVYTVLHEEKS